MSAVEERVLASFFERIAGAAAVPDAVVEGLRVALVADKLPKADQLVQIFTSNTGDTLS